MSILPPFLPQNLRFYLSGPRPCPYLSGRIERKLFTHISPDDFPSNAEVNSALCRAGFRRSQTVLYRPACSDCNACIPVRISVADFSPSRSQRRIIARNRDLRPIGREPEPTPDMFSLFSAYQKERHRDSDMVYMSNADFAAMLKEGRADTHLHCLVDDADVLKGCMIADHVSDGISAVYSFFDPLEPQRGLGTMLILSLIEEAKERHLPYVYLGFWIESSKKMLYKARFRPLQALATNGWTAFDEKQKSLCRATNESINAV